MFLLTCTITFEAFPEVFFFGPAFFVHFNRALVSVARVVGDVTDNEREDAGPRICVFQFRQAEVLITNYKESDA